MIIKKTGDNEYTEFEQNEIDGEIVLIPKWVFCPGAIEQEILHCEKQRDAMISELERLNEIKLLLN